MRRDQIHGRFRLNILAVSLLGVALFYSTAMGAISETEAQGLSDRLRDPAQQDAAINEIKTQIETNPTQAVGYLNRFWFKALTDSKNDSASLELALKAILKVPDQSTEVRLLLEFRVRTLLRTGHPAEALAEARRLFNVAPIRDTESAILLLAECLLAANPQDKSIYDRFRREQIAGAANPTETKSRPVVSQIIASIPIDATQYQESIDQIIGSAQKSKGNLLLLAGRPAEAQKVFEKMLSTVDESDIMACHEDIARAIRAQDGTIGRANAYLTEALNNEDR
jgi:hypothetical protein